MPRSGGLIFNAKGKTIDMFKTALLLVALGLVGAVAFGSRPPVVRGAPADQALSTQEMHALAHLEGLPIYQSVTALAPDEIKIAAASGPR
jgi:hypothetical protein